LYEFGVEKPFDFFVARSVARALGNLPALSIATEMRRMKVWEDEKDFERFESTHGKAIWE